LTEESKNDPMREYFGDPIFTYTDNQAVEDSVLVPFVTKRGDTGHRITRTAWDALREYYRERAEGRYADPEFARFLLSEMLPLIPEAVRTYKEGGILKTTYDFQVTKNRGRVFWFIPNEQNGVTLMRPEDY
jgi:hypothetical protein